MPEPNRKQNYLAQLDESIKELNAAYVAYDNIEFLINIKSMSDSEKEFFKSTENNIRIYEGHAYIRLKSITKEFDTKYPTLKELRKKIKVDVPKKEDVEEIVLTYNEIQLTDLGSETFFKNL